MKLHFVIVMLLHIVHW